jgi:hypothetical protein
MANILLRIARFVEWPNPSSRPPFVIAVAGSDPDEPELCQFSSTEGPQPVLVAVRRVSLLSEMRRSRILFLGRSLGANMKTILHGLDGSGVLTVSSIPGFGEMGGMVEVSNQPEGPPLILNADAARRGGFRFHVGLLSVARLAHSGKDPR